MNTTGHPLPVQLARTCGWRKPPNTITVARPSRWGNPYTVGDLVTVTTTGRCAGWPGSYSARDTFTWEDYDERHLTAADAVRLYTAGLVGSLTDPDPHYDELRRGGRHARGSQPRLLVPARRAVPPHPAPRPRERVPARPDPDAPEPGGPLVDAARGAPARMVRQPPRRPRTVDRMSRVAHRIPGPPAGGRRPYIDRPIDLGDGRTTTVADRVIAAVRAGNYLETAAALAGIAPSTIRDWIREGNATLRELSQGIPEHEIGRHRLRYAEFALDLARAEAEAEAADVARLQQLGHGEATTRKTVTSRKVDGDGRLLEQTTREEVETLPPDSAALRWRLERRHAKRWLPAHQVEVSGPEGGPIVLTDAEKRAALLGRLQAIATAKAEDDDEFTAPNELPEASTG